MGSAAMRERRIRGRSGLAAILPVLAVLSTATPVPAAAGDAVEPESPQAGASATDHLIDRVIARADGLLDRRDVESARLLYRLAASQGSAKAAARLAASYDPKELEALGIEAEFADVAAAAEWYRTAIEAGYPGALASLKRLFAAPEKTVEAAPPAKAPAEASATQPAAGAAPLGAKGKAFWIQLASLPNTATAERERARLKQGLGALLGSKDLRLQERQPGGRTMFGVQTGPFEDRAEADALCELLKAKRQDCFVVW